MIEGGDNPDLSKYLLDFHYRVADLRKAKAPELEGNLPVLLHRLHLCRTLDELHETARPVREMVDIH